MKPISILVADDEAGIRELLLTWLTKIGHAVLCVSSGQEAVKMLKTQRFDLVITDVLMPDGDGLELIAQSKRMQPAARILAISGGGHYLNRRDCLKVAQGLGAHATVPKPFNFPQLLAGIRSSLPTS